MGLIYIYNNHNQPSSRGTQHFCYRMADLTVSGQDHFKERESGWEKEVPGS